MFIMTIHSYYKLETFLRNKGFKVQRAFCIDDMCVYLQTLSDTTGCCFFVYIPSRFNIPVPDNVRSYTLSYVNNTDVVEDENVYGDVKLSSEDGEDISKQLSRLYKQDIPLSSIETTEQREVNMIYSQLERLKSCVSAIEYKLVIQYGNYIGAITRSNDVQLYVINGMDYKAPHRQLFTSIDLPALYARTSHVSTDVLEVKNKVQDILREIYKKHSVKLTEALTNLQEVQRFIQRFKDKQDLFNTKTKELSDAYLRLSKEQETLGEPARNVALFNKNAKERRIDDIVALKNEIMDDLARRNNEQDNMLLVADHFLFNNIVCLTQIIKNTESIKELL